MNFADIWLLAIGVAMDCFAVSIATGMRMDRIQWGVALSMIGIFTFLQTFNPLVGWLGVSSFNEIIGKVDHWVAFGILSILGIKMIHEAGHPSEADQKPAAPWFKMILIEGVATSIDALAVGGTLAFMGVHSLKDLIHPLAAIAICTGLLTALGITLGIKNSNRFARNIKADLWGGIILLAIGIKVLIEHLWLQ